MKQITFNKTFTVTGQQSEEWGEMVSKTAKLINIPFWTMKGLFEKENWSLEEIKRAYQLATKHHGNVKPEVAWWAHRKRRNQ